MFHCDCLEQCWLFRKKLFISPAFRGRALSYVSRKSTTLEQFRFSRRKPHIFYLKLNRFIGGFHVTSSPPYWWTVNKRSLIRSLCLSTSICSFHHCYLCLPRLHENHLYGHRLIRTLFCVPSNKFSCFVNLSLRTLVLLRALSMTEYLIIENLTETLNDLSKVLSNVHSTWLSCKLKPWVQS